MNITRLLVASLALFSLSKVSVMAQQFQLTFVGTCSTTNGSGKIVHVPINNRTLLQDFATANGLPNANGLAVVYHLNGSDLGDTIDVINASSGTTYATLFGLYFGRDLGRAPLLSGDGLTIQRIEYIYTSQNSHSMGAASLTTHFYLDSAGNTNKITIQGLMFYNFVPDAAHNGVQICGASFFTGKQLNFP